MEAIQEECPLNRHVVYKRKYVDGVWFADNQSPYCLTDGNDRSCRNVGLKNYHYSLHKVPQERRSHLPRQPEIAQSSTDQPDEKEQRYSLSL